MSERGSFVTEYIYCTYCFQAAKEVLNQNDKFLCARTIPPWKGCTTKELPIIAGKIGGIFAGEELQDMQFVYGPRLADAICHPIRIAVIPDNAKARVLTIHPKKHKI